MATLTDTDINRLLNKRDLVIWPFDPSSITGLGYDLRIGCIYPLSQFEGFQASASGIIIPPKCYCVIITEEFVWLSGKLIGTLHARGTLAAKGLFTNSTNVDPNFKGQMIMSVVNLSNVDISLKHNDTFLTLILHEVLTPTKTLVGAEGTKKSMRVTNELTNSIYVARPLTNGIVEQFIPERDSANRLHQFLTDSSQKYSDKFELLIREATRWAPVKFVKNLFVARMSIKELIFKRILDPIITMFLVGFVLFVLFQLVSKARQSSSLSTDDWRALVLAIIALLGIWDRLRK